jgi:hypothetical protein
MRTRSVYVQLVNSEFWDEAGWRRKMDGTETDVHSTFLARLGTRAHSFMYYWLKLGTSWLMNLRSHNKKAAAEQNVTVPFNGRRLSRYDTDIIALL